ncbi:MAG TPA: clostripain-related cysteine peptidase [Aggregatilinea sp.]|uniref:clostripain-related cysteine peptidase n=1 Tax=Aggregatilinea sp. TaxID=2806333 RepID=UPI002CF06BF7|nr:clostripain-related cysteine peptidase [Aggregatilinea sp.]HML24762.1 clostripain-related cysteine peptidase [Aggregatilinea sp.]
MRQGNHLKRWLWTWLVVAALALPSVAPVRAAVSSPQDPADLSLRADVSGAASALEQEAAYMDDWMAARPQRPPVDPIAQQATTADWTVMVYVAADNNLEIQGLYDMNEMEAVGSSENVNVVVQIDRAEDYADIDGDWTGGRRYYIQQDDKFGTLNSTLLEDMGEIDSGDPATVADFTTWAITTYPAEHYMLILWDHGGAWIGHASDDESGNDLDLLELSSALEQTVQATGIGKFDVIAFDMCLMGQLEVLETITPYADYGLASEESIPGPGYYYVFLEDLVNDPTMDGRTLATAVVDYYMQFYDEVAPDPDNYYGLTAVDLNQSGAMTAAIDAFSSAVQANPQAVLSAVADARNNTIGYGGYDDPQYYDIWSSVDLYEFAQLLDGITVSPELQQASQGVMQAIDTYVVYDRHNDRLEGSHGVAIYFPRTQKAYDRGHFSERYPAEVPASMASWIAFINTFHGTAVQTVTTAPSVDVVSVYPQTASIYQPAVITLDVSGRDILQVNYAVARITDEGRVVLDFDYLVSRSTTPTGADIVDWSNGVTTRTFAWDAEVPQLTDGTTTTYALMIPNRDNPDLAVVNGLYTPLNGDPVEAQLVFNLNTRTATALWVFTETPSGTVQPSEADYQPGDTFQPMLVTLDEDNQLSGNTYGDTLTFDREQPVRFDKVPAPDGDYSISFVAENVAGDTTLDETLITVQNEGLDASLRGYTDLTYGINFLYPATWIRPRFSPDGKRLFTADLETTTLMSLYPYTDVTNAQETGQAVQASWGDLQDLQVSNEREVDVNGLLAYVADYTYTFNGEARVGAVVAIYVPDQNVGYGFDIDAPASAPDAAVTALNALVASINFFSPQDIQGQSAWQTATTAQGAVSFPVPAGWVEETNGGWTLYGPTDDQNVFIGLTSAAASGATNQELAEYWISQLEGSVSNFSVSASEPYYIGENEWYLVVFTYDNAGTLTAGAFFAATFGGQDYTFWIEAPDAQFDQLYADVFSVSLGGFMFNAAPDAAPTEADAEAPAEAATEAPAEAVTEVPAEAATPEPPAAVATEAATEGATGGSIGSLVG